MNFCSGRSVAALGAAAVLLLSACTSDGGSSSTTTSADSTTSDEQTEESSNATDDPSDEASTEEASSDDTGSGDAGSADAGSEDDTNTATGLDWAPCEGSGGQLGLEQECAGLAVPRDHNDPAGTQIEIAVARLDTAGEADQIGSIVFNPGGPGGSGVEFLTQAAFTIPPEVQQRFDLVSFDPRGVGSSTALTCENELDDEIELLAAGDDVAWQELVSEAEAASEDCTPDTLELAPYVGTNNAARDLDLIRAALGDEGLTYVGYSYGTRLGATYAELFPDNVRALVLDAAVLPTDDFAELDRGQAEGFDRALENFAAACDADADCLLQEIGPTLDVIDDLRTEIDEVGQFPTDDESRVLTPGEFELGIIAALYSKSAWPFLAQGLYIAETSQDGSLLQVLGDQLAGRQPDGTYDNSQVANGFINCADSPSRRSPDEVRADADEAAALSTHFGDALRATTGCIGMPDPIDPLTIGPAEGASPILVIGNSGDPATPYEWSVALADQLSDAVLYTVEAEGHTAYGSIECVTDDVNAYLIDLVVPAEGASCSDNAETDFFVPAGEDEFGTIIRLFDCLRDNGADIPEITLSDLLADPTGESLAEIFDPSNPEIVNAMQGCLDILGELG